MHLRRREVRLPSVPPLTDTYIIPANVHKVYSQISAHFGNVQIGLGEQWVVGADTAQGGIRIFFTLKGVMQSLQAVRDGKDITRAVQGDIGKAITLLSSQRNTRQSA